mgnify:CR=1 FL=1
MVKMTFTFDEDTVHQLELAAARTKKPKSQVVREAIRDYADRADKLSHADILIAACAITHKAKLSTLNPEDFADIPNLVLER